jgi:hypothetical protein
MGSENILIWNVRGLNAGTHRAAVRDLVTSERPSLVCLQETKMNVICDFDIPQIIGRSLAQVLITLTSWLCTREVVFLSLGRRRCGQLPVRLRTPSRSQLSCTI